MPRPGFKINPIIGCDCGGCKFERKCPGLLATNIHASERNSNLSMKGPDRQPHRRWKMLSDRIPRSIEEVVEVLLENRNLESVSFLDSKLSDLQAYLNILNLDEAAQKTVEHLSRQHHVLLIGDYDCDGISAAALLSLFLRDIGYCRFDVILPTREEGYGIPARAVSDFGDTDLVITMDCGTMEVEPVAALRANGSDVIVLDHHEVSEQEQAPATILVNPKQPGCPAPFREPCSAGLVLLFLTRVRRYLNGQSPRPKLDGRYLALAALATVADMVPLVEANRIIVQAGLRALNQGKTPALEQLRNSAGLSQQELKASHIAFQLAPRINAAGRLADPLLAYDFLMAQDESYAALLAGKLEQLNLERRRLEREAIAEIERRLEREGYRYGERRSLVLGDSKWNPGLVGILASRVQQRLHYGPVIVCSYDRQLGLARGSARSVPGFDLQQALAACDSLLTRWGGHKMAAGLSLPLENVAAFQKRFEQVARQSDPQFLVPEDRVDMELDPGLVSEGLLDALAALEPFGMGNPAPLFMARGKSISIRRTFGKQGMHLDLLVDGRIPAVFWNGASRAQRLLNEGQAIVDLVFDLDWDAYHKQPRLRIKALLADMLH